MRRRTPTVLAATAGLTLLPGAALTQTSEQQGTPATRETPTPGETGTEAQGTGLWERSDLFGDMGGLRPALGRVGATLGLTETSELLGNPTGGSKTGAVYEGAAEMSLGVDLGKAVGLQGGLFNASAWQIRGRGLSTNNIDNLMVVSSIEADRATRLFELWYQQSFLEGKLDVRLGQLAADQEFTLSQYAGLFINSSFGWPTLPAVDLPAGGPAYPFATPGVRVRVLPNEQTTLLLGVFNGNPAANANFPPSDPQLRNPSGANIRFQGTFVIGEVQYALNQGEGAKGLPATFRLGAWYNSNSFTNQFFATGGETAAVPGVILLPSQFRRDWSVYAVVDQLVWRPPGAKEGDGMGVFLRAMGAPANRNQVVAFVDGGVTLKGPFGRAGDSVGLGFGWTRISGVTVAGEQALVAGGAQVPIQSAETVIELTYQAQLAPWWLLQPDFQYVFNPGGGILNPNGSGRVVGSAAVFGLRTVVTF